MANARLVTLRVFVCALLLALTACGKDKSSSPSSGGGSDEIEEISAPLVTDRVIQEVAIFNTATGKWDEHGQLTYSTLSAMLGALCRNVTTDPLCPVHMALQLANEVRPEFVQEVTADTWSLSPIPKPGLAFRYRLPVPKATDSATYCLVASNALLSLLAQLTPFYFNDTVPPTDLATALTRATLMSDIVTSLHEAETMGRRFVVAAATAKTGDTKLDQQAQVIHAWRDRHDSRLEAVSTLGRTMPEKYEPDPGTTPVGTEFDRYPVAIATKPSRGEKRAEELIRYTRVNPCLKGMGPWCAQLANSTRDPIQLAKEITMSVTPNDTTGNGYGTLLAKRSITLFELERAARRVVRQAQVLGQAIVSDPIVSTPPRVLGTSGLVRSPSPYYLYTQTLGNPAAHGAMTDLATITTAFQPPDYFPVTNYAATSSAAAIAIVGAKMKAWLTRLFPTGALPEHARIVAASAAFATEIAQHHQGVAVQQGASAITNIRLERTGLPFASATDAAAQCNIWLGEAGLECGLAGTVGGKRCDETMAVKYRVVNTGLTWTVASGRTSVVIPAANVPSRVDLPTGATITGIQNKDRLYGICEISQVKEVAFAVEVPTLPANTIRGGYTPPLSKSVLDALQEAIGADSLDPAQSARSCAGVPYNTKIALEDELTEAITGQDGVESSFAYYLKLAREAADKSDQLGEQLVDHSLQMDLRAEAAREELEDLCGGVVDLKTLEATACKDYKCDLFAMLEAEQNNADLEGVRKCLGVTERPVWASISSAELCVWQYFPPAVGGVYPPPSPPLVCPPSVTACTSLSKVPEMRGADGSCANSFGATQITSLPDRPGPTDHPSGLVAWPITRTLALDVAPFPPPDPPKTQCLLDVASERGWTTGILVPGWPVGPLFQAGDTFFNSGFLKQTTLRPVADAIGYTEDVYGVPTITINSRPWIRFGTSSPQAPTTWPCTSHPVMSSPFQSGQEAWARMLLTNHPASLFYSGTCAGAAGGTIDEPNWAALTRRMRDAVVTLKGITGASFANVVERRLAWGSVSQIEPEQMLSNGTIPTWAGGLANTTHYVSADGNRMTYSRSDGTVTAYLGNWLGTDQARVGRPTTLAGSRVSDARGYLGSGGWIDPVLLWSPESKCSLNDGGKVRGCGDMYQVLFNNGTRARSQVEYAAFCPVLPEEEAKKQVVQLKECKAEQPSSTTNPALVDYCNSINNTWWWGKGTVFTVPEGGKCACRKAAGPIKFADLVKQNTFSEQLPSSAFKWLWNDIKKYACGNNVVMGTEVSRANVIDALELACSATMSGTVDCSQDLSATQLKNEDDFPRVKARIACAASAMQKALGQLYLADVPVQAIDAIRENRANQVFPAFRGQYGEEVATLSGQLSDLVTARDSIVTSMRDISALFDRAMTQANVLDLNIKSSDLEAQISANMAITAEYQSKIENLRTRQAIAQQVTNCAVGLASIASGGVFSIGGGIASAAATCANSAVQIASEVQISQVQDKITAVEKRTFDLVQQKIANGVEITEAEKTLLWQQLGMDITKKIDDMRLAMGALNKTQSLIHGTLARLDATRQQARRAASKAMLLASDDLQRSYGVNAVMRARLDTLAYRYREARQNALKLSFLARRSVEQRLGVDLSMMEDKMTLVPAPRSWVDGLCETTGIDYERIRKGEGVSTDPTGKELGYGQEFVGDWLTKLENVVESYRLDYPFQDGGDVAVVSLRDEIVRTKKTCDLPGWNLLYQTDGTSGMRTVNLGETTTPASPWQTSCASGRIVQALPTLSFDNPFLCDSNSVGNCRELGEVKNMFLSNVVASCAAVSASDTVASENNVPRDGIIHWIQGDECTAPTTLTGDPIVCTDKTAPLRYLRLGSAASTTLPTINATGIGGRPTLTITPGATLFPGSTLATPATAYTQIFVARRGRLGTTDSFMSQTSVDGLSGFIQLAFGQTSRPGPNGFNAYGSANVQISSPRLYNIVATSPFAAELDPQRGDIYALRAETGPNGAPGYVRLYINGALRAETTLQGAIPTQFLGALLANRTGASPFELAEMMDYNRALTDTEFEQVHSYLATYYKIDRAKPSQWLSGDVVREMRNGTGSSASSGYNFGAASTVIRDAANGADRASVTGGIESFDAFAFAAGKYAVRFDGVDDSITFQSSAWKDERTATNGTQNFNIPGISTKDYAVTVVAKCDDATRIHRLWGSPSTSDGILWSPYLWLEVNGTTGAVGYSGSTMAGASTLAQVFSEPNMVNCNATPFILTLRASSTGGSSGVMELYVNGELRLSTPGAVPITPASVFGHNGGVTGRWFKGDMAEALVHQHAMDGDAVRALHASLGTKYGFAAFPGAPAVADAGPPRVMQQIKVTPGDYWVTWLQKNGEARLRLRVDRPGEAAFEFLPPADTSATIAETIFPIVRAPSSPNYGAGAITDQWLSSNWRRHYVKVSVKNPGFATFGWAVPSGSTNISFAAPQVQRADNNATEIPKEYFPTRDTLLSKVDKCEDSRGEVFRTKWERSCEYYCPPALGANCATDGFTKDVPRRCFREMRFPISLEQIEKGELLPAAGFARGNFNYRFDQVALNFVGTAVKDCSDNSLPSACYAANFLQYSLKHGAPFRIRNYDGDVVDAPLFSGNVQQAKGLLAERYVTNPLSGSDTSLLKDYWRDEFRGRPIDGNFILRVYENEGLDFNALEDVQLVLRYRYWTRFDP